MTNALFCWQVRLSSKCTERILRASGNPPNTRTERIYYLKLRHYEKKKSFQ